jgi:imidazolonepropionase-like amidohydrolase
VIVLGLVALAAAAEIPAGDALLRDARVVDARGVVGERDIVLRGGRIEAVVAEYEGELEGLAVVELGGATVVPGLIDTHVHISMAPGAAWRGPPPEGADARREQHLRAYLSWGVTTLLDPAIVDSDARSIQALLDAGAPAPRVVWLGPTFSPTGGYVHAAVDTFPEVGTPEEARALFDTFDGLETAGVKVTMEEGLLRPIWPLHSQEVRGAIQAECGRRGQDIYVHAMKAEMYRQGLAMGPRAFVHAPQEPIGPELAAEVAAAGVYVEATLPIVLSALQEWDTALLTSAHARATVPAEELETALDPEIHRDYKRAVAAIAMPGLPGFLVPLGARAAGREATLQRRTEHMIAAVAELHAAGVPIVTGSDSGNWPVLPFLVHGPSYHLELQGLARAGLTPLEVLTAATLTPAQMLRLEDEIGTVEAGKVADLLVLDGDPLEDLEVLQQPRYTIRAGEIRTPAEWMAP